MMADLSRQQKRIVLIANSPLFFSQHLRPIVRELSTFSDVYLISLSSDEYSLADLFPACRTIEIPGRREPSFVDPASILIFMVYRLWLKPDLVISFTPKGGLINACTKLGHGITCHYFTGQRWALMGGLKRIIFEAIDRFIGRSCYAVLCDSDSQRRFIYKSLGLSNVEVIGAGSISGVDTDRFRIVEDLVLYRNHMLATHDELFLLRNNSHDIVVGFIGRLHEDKGIDIAIDMCYQLAECNVSSILVAIGPVEVKNPELIKKALREEKLIHLSYREDIHLYYPLFDVLVLPSLREGFGSVVIEAASSGVPVVASDIPGPRDFIRHGETGMLVKQHRSSAFADALLCLHEDELLREKILNNAYQKAREFFSEDFVCKSFASWVKGLS